MRAYYLETFCRFVLVATFVLAAISKIHSRKAWQSFMSSVTSLAGVSRSMPIAGLVVFSEAVCSALLLTPRTTIFGLALGLTLLLAFTAVVFRALRRGRSEQCRCFGTDHRLSGVSLARNAFLVGITVVAGVANLSRTDLGSVPPLSHFLPAITGIVIAVAVAYAEEAVSVVRQLIRLEPGDQR